MKSASLSIFLIISLLLHLFTVVLLQSSTLFVSNLPIYADFEVTSSVSSPTTTTVKSKSSKRTPVTKSKIITALKTDNQIPESLANSSDLPVPADGKSVTQGLIPLNLDEINKTIKRSQSASEKNIEGIIKLKLLVDETGRVRAVTALSQLGYGLDEIAVAAAWKLVFKPARVDSRNVPLETIYSVKFDITHQ